MSKSLILASSSPRRRELLQAAGIPCRVEVADISEAQLPQEEPVAYARRLAREKAAEVAKRFADHPILAADTIVVIDRDTLGKPKDNADAARMLRALSGRSHEVITAICLRTADGESHVHHEVTSVHMSELSEKEICDYVAHGEPMDKAGAYAIQGIASRWVTKIEGDYANVVGLPVAQVYAMLRRHGVVA